MRSPYFRQVPLREARGGLAKAIATLDFEPSQLAERLRVRFENTSDDLDEMEAALIVTEAGRQFGLVRHRHQPGKGTDILVDEHSSDITADFLEIDRLFSPAVGHRFVWIHPDVKRNRTSEVKLRSSTAGRLRELLELEGKRERLLQELVSLTETMNNLSTTLLLDLSETRARHGLARGSAGAGRRQTRLEQV